MPSSFSDHIYDFGRLSDQEERVYIEEICRHALSKTFSTPNVSNFTQLLIKSHEVARKLSADEPSAVSLRDATRAASLFRWFRTSEAGRKMTEDTEQATHLAIYLVYAFRFQERHPFLTQVFCQWEAATSSVAAASKKIADKLYAEARGGTSIGSGAIALNGALCENLFALYVCVLNGIFVIIVGRPGSSKSLSMEILNVCTRNSLRSQQNLIFFRCVCFCNDDSWSSHREMRNCVRVWAIFPP